MQKLKVASVFFVLFVSIFLLIGCPSESSNAQNYDAVETEDTDNQEDYEEELEEEFDPEEDTMYSEDDLEEEEEQ